ncbi:MAG: Fur family transcriptional regulator, ferric uptake regulator [Chloroflexota bacterium]|jgi:Fur family ferric uptake transcriptional regulator|nr:Fur family transcriptional regulator, ferric uptake regulator [Chloroflexota bacterium]
MSGDGSAIGLDPTALRAQLRDRGMRWTPQRRLILDVLRSTSGHVTGSEIVERCRARDPETTPSTIYRTLDVLEDLGYLHHSHGAGGREEFHVLPAVEHGHLQCVGCGESWEIGADEVADLLGHLQRSRGFAVDVGHLTIAGRCAACSADGADTGFRPG